MASKQKETPAPTPEKETDLRKVGALWLKTAKSEKATRYMSGEMELPDGSKVSLTVFKNGFKKQDNHPDYVIYIRGGAETPDAVDSDIPF